MANKSYNIGVIHERQRVDVALVVEEIARRLVEHFHGHVTADGLVQRRFPHRSVTSLTYVNQIDLLTFLLLSLPHSWNPIDSLGFSGQIDKYSELDYLIDFLEMDQRIAKDFK